MSQESICENEVSPEHGMWRGRHGQGAMSREASKVEAVGLTSSSGSDLSRREILDAARRLLLVGLAPAGFLHTGCGGGEAVVAEAAPPPACALDGVVGSGETLARAALEALGGTPEEARERLVEEFYKWNEFVSRDELVEVLRRRIVQEWGVGATIDLEGWLFTPTELDLAASSLAAPPPC